MTPRERMFAALDGKPTDFLPVAPCFWGAEYAWKLTGLPMWEVLHGVGDMQLLVADALVKRHAADWLLPNHWSSGQLAGKTFISEDLATARFTDDATGDEWIFHKEGHWLLPAKDVTTAKACHAGTDIEPPRTKDEADEWLKRMHRHLGQGTDKHIPNRMFRDRYPERFLVGGVLHVFANIAYSLGFEPTMVLLSENPSLCSYLMERTMESVPRACAALAADGYDAAVMCDSFASADMMSPKVYRDWVAPMHKLISDECHKAGLKSIMYNTGNILPLLDTIKNLGYDALLAEERIKGVEICIGQVREGLGPDMCVFGNLDSYLLLRGDREMISTEIRRQIKEAGPVSFVMSNGSPICDETNPEIVDFMIRETRIGG